MNKAIRDCLLSRLYKLTTPPHEVLVRHLVSKTCGLELTVNEVVRLAPLSDDVIGPFVLTGNSLPVFTYKVFDKKLMDFIQVRVEIALPNRISFTPKLILSGTDLTVREVPLKAAYSAPFILLARHLYHYFPLVIESKGPIGRT